MSSVRFSHSYSRPVALVTGAAGGIGGMLVSRLVAEGYHVLAFSRKGEPTAQPFVTPVACDLTQPEQIEAAVADLANQNVALQAVVHCAGVITPQRMGTTDTACVSAQLMVNLEAPILLTMRALPLLPPGGHVVFINSMAALVPLEGSSIYTASKFGLRGFALSLAQDVQKSGIHVSSVFPGAVDTPMLRREIDNGGSPLNFVTAPATADEIAAIVQQLLHRPRAEVFCPSSDGILAQLMLMMPRVWRLILPVLLKKGRKGQKKYLAAQQKPPV
ncbi:short-chain dehydrogenase [Acetobacter senegalensis]|uniref:Short-chain dehydrogenase n=1 Tax=Acetobacter senegalensis TaxID=446692 RepID=A0A149U673_9PROT|nr:SDR family oxidoreductase [Acetobacter senegalensis]KXV60912.1 short-chain dehydrogenase [Acetobacter senegalensis]